MMITGSLSPGMSFCAGIVLLAGEDDGNAELGDGDAGLGDGDGEEPEE